MHPPIRLFLATTLGLLFSLPALPAAAESFSLQDTQGQYLDVLRNDKIVARYRYSHDVSTKEKVQENYKPYLEVYDETGTRPITKGAGGVLPHHRGIYIGWNGITVNGEKYDRWHMKGGDQVHGAFVSQKATPQQASFTSLVRWQGKTPVDTIIEEERTLTFLPGTSPVYQVIEMSSKLKAVLGDVFLNRDPEHSGLQFRPANEVDRKLTSYIYPSAKPDVKTDKYRWFGETFTLGGKPYSVVYLSHPSNPEDSTTSAYRDYGRMGQTWSLTIPKGQTQEFRARFLIATGEMLKPEVIQAAWNDYAGKQEPVPEVTIKKAAVSNFDDPNNPKPKATPAAKGEEKKQAVPSAADESNVAVPAVK